MFSGGFNVENNKKITFKVPNKDIWIRSGTVFPKEVIQKSYIEKIGMTIEVCGIFVRLIDVIIDDEFINLILTAIPEEILKLEKILYNLNSHMSLEISSK